MESEAQRLSPLTNPQEVPLMKTIYINAPLKVLWKSGRDWRKHPTTPGSETHVLKVRGKGESS